MKRNNKKKKKSEWLDYFPLQPKIDRVIKCKQYESEYIKKQLGININRFEHLANRESSQVNTEDVLRNIYYILKNFGQVQSNFKQLFAKLHLKVKDFLFLHDRQICQKYKIREGSSNRKAIKMIDKFHQLVIKNKDNQFASLSQEFAKKQHFFRESLQEKEIIIFNLKQQVQKFKKLANVEYVRSLETKIQNLKELVSSQEDQYKLLAKKNQQLSLQLQAVRRQLQEYESKCVRYESNIYDLNVQKQKTQIYLLNFKDRFHQLTSRLESLKNIIKKVQQENENLVSERMKLVNRAAVTFEQLTPRPKYSNYFKFDEKSNLASTQQIMQKLVGQVQEKQEFFQKYCIAKKNRKLIECEAIRQKTVQQIAKAKIQLNMLLI